MSSVKRAEGIFFKDKDGPEKAVFFYCSGNMQKFEELLKTISPTLKRITYKLNGHFSYFNDEDLYQEALAHLWQEFQAGTLHDKTDSYILQGCYFHLKNYIRTARPKLKTVSIHLSSDAQGPDRQDSFILEDERSGDYFNRLNDKLLVETINNNGLNPKEKYVLSLCSEGLTTREIGKKLGVSHVSVVKIMARIRNKCKHYRDTFRIA